MASAPSPAPEPALDFAAIVTSESAVRDVHKMVLRYSDAIRAYAGRLLPTGEDAENVHLAVVQSMLQGRFSKGLGEKGRFRFYVKRAVRNAVLNYQRQRFREQSFLKRFWSARVGRQSGFGEGAEGVAGPAADAAVEAAELGIWRATVLNRAIEAALKALEEYERQQQERDRPNVYHTLARLLIEHGEDTSDQLAQRLGEQVGGQFNASQVRGITLRMRSKLAELLFREIVPQLDDPTYDNVLDELADLGLLAYVRPYLPPKEPAAAGA
jgi:hypothetical protein